MTLYEELISAGEYCAAGLFEESGRSLFYRKALALRRYYESVSLPKHTGGKLYPGGRIHNGMCVYPNYSNGIAISEKMLESKVPGAIKSIVSDFFRYSSTVPKEHSVAGNMFTHSMPHYRRIAAEGLDSYAERVKKLNDRDFREGLLHLIEGIRCYVSRAVNCLKSENADAALINALEQVPFKPARNIYEAIVCHNLLFYLDGCDNLGCLASDLMPYYNGENITELLCELFDNCDINSGYSMSLGADYNPITLQCLEAIKGKRRPMIELFISDSCPDEVWNAALDAVRSGGGQPAFYNHKLITRRLSERFPEISAEDINRFCGGGCTETMLEGLCNVGSLDAGINLPLILTEVIHTKLISCESFEEFYSAFILAVEEVVNTVTREIAASQKARAELNPLPMRTLLTDDCIDRELDFNNGGARYKWSIINFAGMINIIDSMLVIEDYVFISKKYSAKEFTLLLSLNDKKFLLAARRHPVCFGVDNDRANELSSRLSQDIFSLLDNKKTAFGSGFIPASIQFQTAAEAGKCVPATPDGRSSGDPLCESLGAISSKDIKGPTAMLSSVASLKLELALGIPVVNLTVNQKFDNSVLRALIKGYMNMGGMHLQLTCVSKEILEEAYADPDKHRNLVIRVGGYSEYFNRLSDDLKKLVLARTIH